MFGQVISARVFLRLAKFIYEIFVILALMPKLFSHIVVFLAWSLLGVFLGLITVLSESYGVEFYESYLSLLGVFFECGVLEFCSFRVWEYGSGGLVEWS